MKWKISTALSELMPTSPFGITDDDYSTIQWMDSGNSLPTIDVINAKIAELDAAEPMRLLRDCLLYTSPSPRDLSTSRMPSSA